LNLLTTQVEHANSSKLNMPTSEEPKITFKSNFQSHSPRRQRLLSMNAVPAELVIDKCVTTLLSCKYKELRQDFGLTPSYRVTSLSSRLWKL